MHKKSKAAFEHNIKAEMNAGKPQDQSLAIAYSIKRKGKKKAAGGSVESGSKDMNMAEGGMAYKNDSAKTQERPMPEERDNDSEMVSRNSGNKPAKQDSWIDRPDKKQAGMGKIFPLKYPKMVPSDAFSSRLRDEENDLERSASPGPYGKQPPRQDDEEGPDRQGPQVRDNEAQHSNGRKAYAKGGEMRPDNSGVELMEQLDEAHLMDEESPSEDEGYEDAMSRNEESPNRQGPRVPDMEDEHSTGKKAYASGGSVRSGSRDMDYAEGGDIQYRDAMDYDDDMDMNPAHGKYSADDSEDQPDDESIEHDASVAGEIMAKRRKYSRGGEIMEESEPNLSADSMETHEDEDQVDLSRNADEDQNMEDQASFDALKKENYSESDGLKKLNQPDDSNLKGDDEESDSENEHDGSLVDQIRRKMKQRSPISR